MASIVGIPLSKVSPAFLHANSTSHTWVFSAFAELIDNAYDPDVSASELLIDQIDIRNIPCLIFLDNGAGMDRDHLLKMLSFGFCEKDIYERQGSHQPIGHYGNGFKSGSMRIGLDALVFTRCQHSASIGFLSQTYLKAIQTDCVVVPILEYRLPKLERIKSQESRNNLNAILQYSVFKLEEELKAELRALEGSKTGTKIIISNLKRLQDGTYELDFSSDPTDIRCPEAHEVDLTSVYNRPIQHTSSEYKRSLREYCSILFLRPRMKITIRGVRVKSKLVSKSLSNTEIDMYKPTWLSRPVKIIFGFTCETDKSEDYGMMLYHRNRLIKAYEKVGYQKQPNELGIGVVGVAQVDFLQPIHNKQDFNKDEKFNSVMSAFAMKLNDYWNEKKGQQGSSSLQQMQRNLPDWLWAQCDQCLKWRRLPDGIDGRSLPDQWYCRMNPDATHNRCDIPEEPEDEDLAVKPTYEKTFKKKMEERKRLRQIEMDREEEIKKRKIMEKERELREKEAALRAIQHVATQPVQETQAMTALQKELAAARQREEQQRQLIQRIQQQSKQMEEQRNSLLQMAESLQTLKGKKSKDALDQMNQIIETLSPSLSAISNRRQVETSSPAAARKIVKPFCIKTETGEILSVTQNDVNGCETGNIGIKDSAVGKLNKASANRSLPSKDIKPKDTLKVSTSFISNKPDSKIVNGHSPKKTDNQSGVQVQTPRRTRQRHKAEKVLAVIDLTSDKEYGELVDIKPDLEELRSSLQDNLRSNSEDVKPDKNQLDAVIANNDAVKEGSLSAKAVAEAKKEIMDTVYSESGDITQQPHGKNKNSNNSDDPMNSEIPVNLEDNIEAAMAAIQEKMEKERFRKKELSLANDSQISISSGSKNLNDRPERLNSESSMDSLPDIDSDCDRTNGFNIKEEKEEQSLINRLQLSVNHMSDDEDIDAFDNSNNHNPTLFSQPVDKACENKTEASHQKDEIPGSQSIDHNEIDNVNICGDQVDQVETLSDINKLGDQVIVSSIMNESPLFENRKSPKIYDNEADHNFQACNSADEDTYCSSGEDSLNSTKADNGKSSSMDCSNAEYMNHEVDLVEKIGDDILKDIVSLKRTMCSKDSTPNNVISSNINDPTLSDSSLIFCKPHEVSPAYPSDCTDTSSNSNIKTAEQITKVMDHTICNSKVAVFHKETQTTSECASVAEVQTEKSSFDTECDLEEQLIQAKSSLSETTLKLSRFYSNVQRLLRLSNPELVVVEGDDIEQIIQNLIEMKQEPHTNAET